MTSLPRLARSALVAGLLLAVTLMPSTGAQINIRFGSDDTSYGWNFPDGTFAGAEATDPAGDLQLIAGPGAVPIGAAPVQAAADLVRVRLDEIDGELLRVRLEVADLDPLRMHAESLLGLTDIGYVVTFAVGGNAYEIRTYYGLECTPGALGICEPLTSPGVVIYATLYRVDTAETERIGTIASRVLVDQSAVELLIPRWSLDRTGPGLHPLAGDSIDALRVQAQAGFCIFALLDVEGCVRYLDELPDVPNESAFYTLTKDSNGSLIALSTPQPPDTEIDPNAPPGPTFEQEALEPRMLVIDVDGRGTVRVPLTITNHLDHKALVAPSGSVVSGGATLRVPPSINVPALSSRPMVIDLDVPSEEAGPIELELSVRALGRQTETGDALRLLVRLVPGLSPESPRLYLHTEGEEFAQPLSDATTMFTFSSGFLSTLPDDPLDNGNGATLSSQCFCADNVDYWLATGAQTKTLHLDTETPATLHLEADAPLRGSLRLMAALTYDETTIASGERTFELVEGPNVLDVPLRVAEDAATVPSGAVLALVVQAEFSPGAALPLGELVGIVQPLDPRMKTLGASWLELPLLDAAERFGSAGHLIVDLGRGHDPVQYVNPGGTALWNVTVLNQGEETDDVLVGLTSDAGWALRAEPGRAYSIPAGESVTVGVLATAPDDATEGAVAKINVTITSGRIEGATSGLSVAAVATGGVAIADAAFVADNDTAAAVRPDLEEKGSPVTVMPGLLAALALGLAALRRRSR